MPLILTSLTILGLAPGAPAVAGPGPGSTTTTTGTSTTTTLPPPPPPTATPPPPPASPHPAHDSVSESVPTEPVKVPPPPGPLPPNPTAPLLQQTADATVGHLQRSFDEAIGVRAAAARHLEALTRDIAALEGRVAGLDADRQRLALLLLESRRRLRERAVASYMRSPVAPVNDALSAKEFMDFSRRVAMVGAVIEAERKRVRAHEARQQELNVEIQRLVTDLDRARSALATATAVLHDADATVLQKKVLLDAAGVGGKLVAGGFVFPVSGPHTFTDSFGAPRMPGTPFAHSHQGTDVFAPPGTPLVAVERGILVRVGTDVLGGIKLWLVGASGTRYFYAHLSAFAPGVVENKLVEAGEVVGYVGNTGNAQGTPAHLHFEVHPGGGPAINPYPLLRMVDDVRLRLPSGAPAPAAPAPSAPLPPVTSPPVLAPRGSDEAGRQRAELELKASEGALQGARAEEAKAADRARRAEAGVRDSEARLAQQNGEEQAAALQLAGARGRMRDLAVANYVTGGSVGPSVHYLLRAENAEDLVHRSVLVNSASAAHRATASTYEQARKSASERADAALRGLEAANVERAQAVAELAGAAEKVRRQTADVEHRRLMTRLVTAAVPVPPSDIPRLFLDAYRRAAVTMQQAAPTCGLRWSALAAVGKTESDHGRSNGAQLALNGDVMPHIVGVPLAGVADTDRGQLDGDTARDRAVGPMQFLPSTWRQVARDGSGDGRADPHNAYDAALGAATYLCQAGPPGALAGEPGLRAAFLAYDRSAAHADAMLGWVRSYEAMAGQLPP